MSGVHRDVVWRPDGRGGPGEFDDFLAWLAEHDYVDFGQDASYRDVWAWSVEDVGRFWRAFAEYVGIGAGPAVAVAPTTMPSIGWFPATELNYAERALAVERVGDAIISINEDGTRSTTSWTDLRCQVGAVAGFLRDNGVKRGDRVAGVLPNRTEAVVGLLAAASVGAIWSVVAPEFGASAIISRLQQLEPTVLIAVSGYQYGGKSIDRTDVMQEVVDALPELKHLIRVDGGLTGLVTDAQVSALPEIMRVGQPWISDPVPFEHPLWVLFSSGTTGVPKGIVHGHGGVVLEHLKTLTLHAALEPGDRFLVVGSTSWVVWNTLVSGLLRGCTIVLLDGNPAHPDVTRVWKLAAQEQVSMLGIGAAYVHASMRAGISPKDECDLGSLRMLHVTGSPLSEGAYSWVYEDVGDVWLASVSGGTDVAGIFLGAAPREPVRLGRLQPPALGVAAASWSADGVPVLGEAGELVITEPMPSMPVAFWNDPDGKRYHDSYFATYAGVWRHGDLVEFDDDGSSVILGRSDSTLNRNGIRLGPSDLYRVVEALPEIKEAMVVGVEEGDGYYMPLFVHLEDGVLPERAEQAAREAIRTALSPRYVPDEVIVLCAIPHTRTGKKLEVPAKRILLGAPVEEVVDVGSVDSVEALRQIRAVAAARQARA